MSSPRKPRIRSIDYLKGLLIVCVVLCHAFGPGDAFHSWVCAFGIPAFFFASGLFLKVAPPTPAEAAGEVWKRFYSLMVPYFFWALVGTLVWATLTPHALVCIAYASHKTLFRAKTVTSLWFLPVLFLACAAWAAARLAFGRRFVPWVRAVFAAAAFAVAFLLPHLRVGWPWGANVAFCALGCLVAGNLAAPAIGRLREVASRGGAGALLPLLLAAAGFAGSLGYGLNLPPNGYINVAEAAYGNPFLFLALAATGTLFAVGLTVFLEAVTEGGRAWTLRWLEIVGTNTLGILCIHRFFLRLLRPLAASVDLPKPFPGLLIAIAALVGSTLLSMLLARLFPPAVGLPFAGRSKQRCKPARG